MAAATTESALCSIEDAIDLAFAQGCTQVHHVISRVGGQISHTALVKMHGGAHVHSGKGQTYEDALTRALIDAGVTW